MGAIHADAVRADVVVHRAVATIVDVVVVVADRQAEMIDVSVAAIVGVEAVRRVERAIVVRRPVPMRVVVVILHRLTRDLAVALHQVPIRAVAVM
jgi:hypothetical protein